MLKKLTLLSFFIVINLILLNSPVYSEQLPKFKIMTESWEPYSYEVEGVVTGISTDILVYMLKEVGSVQGYKDIHIYPWMRAFKTCMALPDTILYTTARTKERETLFKWVGPLFKVSEYFYSLKANHIELNDYSDLKKYKIGTLRGDVVEEMLTKKTGMSKHDFVRVASNKENTKHLVEGRVDIVVQSKVTTMTTIEDLGYNPEKFEKHMMLGTAELYYAFNRKTPDYIISKFQKALVKLKKEGKIAEVFHKYQN